MERLASAVADHDAVNQTDRGARAGLPGAPTRHWGEEGEVMNRSAFGSGVLAGMLLMVAALGVNWLITPARHPDAATGRYVATIVQIVVGIGVATWLYLRYGRG